MGLLNYETNKMKANPITKEEGEGDLICAEEVGSNKSYVSWAFSDENEAYNVITHMRWKKDLESVKA